MVGLCHVCAGTDASVLRTVALSNLKAVQAQDDNTCVSVSSIVRENRKQRAQRNKTHERVNKKENGYERET